MCTCTPCRAHAEPPQWVKISQSKAPNCMAVVFYAAPCDINTWSVHTWCTPKVHFTRVTPELVTCFKLLLHTMVIRLAVHHSCLQQITVLR
jgi:hypothetical protein